MYKIINQLLPLLISGISTIILLLKISWNRNHIISLILTLIGLSLSFLSLYKINFNNIIDLVYIDRFELLFIGLILISSFVTSILFYFWLHNYPMINYDEFYLLILLTTIGSILLVSSKHFLSLFLGIELISLPLFGMIGYICFQKKCLEASIKYTLFSAISSTFILFGMAFIYANTGQLSFNKIGTIVLSTIDHSFISLFLIGLGMMIVGFGVKLSLAPFHMWTPDVYQGAPTPVSILLSINSKISIFIVLVRLFSYIVMHDKIRLIFNILACCSMLLGNLMALNQYNIKRLLSYSSIAHFGYLIITLIGINDDAILALESIGIYLISYFLANLGIFSIINLLESINDSNTKIIIDSDSLLSYRGLFWHKPILSFLLTIIMLSLAGIPMTLGFIGKFYLIVIGLHTHQWIMIGGIIICSSISLLYYLKFIINLYVLPINNISKKYKINFIKLDNWLLRPDGIIILTSGLLLFLLGIYPQPLINLVKKSLPIDTISITNITITNSN